MIAVGRENLRIAACLHIISGDTATTKVKVTNQEDGPIDPFWPHASATEIEGEPTEPNGL
jgi:hypothetical protein